MVCPSTNMSWTTIGQRNHVVFFCFVFLFFGGVFSVQLLSVLRGHSVFPSPPQRPMTSDFEGFLYQILSITLLFLILIIFQTWFILQRLQNQNIEFILHVHFFIILMKRKLNVEYLKLVKNKSVSCCAHMVLLWKRVCILHLFGKDQNNFHCPIF